MDTVYTAHNSLRFQGCMCLKKAMNEPYVFVDDNVTSQARHP